MEKPSIPLNEQERLAELYRFDILDTPPEEEFNDIVQLASQACKTPIATISFVDKTRQWVKAIVGLKDISKERDTSFCGHTILGKDLFEVRNALRDKRFSDNPLVKQKPKIRFYAAMPLITSKGFTLGALCVIDTIPRKLTSKQAFALKVLSKQTVKLLELRLLNKDIMLTTETHKRIISVMSHDIRSPLNSIQSYIDLTTEQEFSEEEKKKMFDALGLSVKRTLQLLDNLVEWSKIQLYASKERHTFKLREVVDECIEQTALNAAIKQNKLINSVNADIVVEADREGVQFILRNLLSNAIKFTQNGTIKVDLVTKNNKLYLCVCDNGVGIEMNRVKQILDPVVTYTSKGTQNEKGSGLGLSLIKSYLDKSGNLIDIKSAINEGTRVSFSICTIEKSKLIPKLTQKFNAHNFKLFPVITTIC